MYNSNKTSLASVSMTATSLDFIKGSTDSLWIYIIILSIETNKLQCNKIQNNRKWNVHTRTLIST